MVSYTLFNVGCLDKVSLKLCFGDKVPTTKVLWGDAISGGVFAFFGLLYPALGGNPINQFFRSSFFSKLDYHTSL